MKDYAITREPALDPYITPGKYYEIVRFGGGFYDRTFYIVADDGSEIFCKVEDSNFLDGKNWTIVRK
jgi:hypothetical protein